MLRFSGTTFELLKGGRIPWLFSIKLEAYRSSKEFFEDSIIPVGIWIKDRDHWRISG